MKKITIIGAGTMGSIFAQALAKDYEVRVCKRDDDKAVCQDSDAVIIAVKPQSFPELAKELKNKLDSALIISIMAGVSIDKIENSLGAEKVVRAMPNLGARIGKSMTVWTDLNCSEQEKQEVKILFNKIGQELYAEKEEMIDKATAVSGSGPGFFFYLIKEWLKAVENLGFSKQEAEKLLFATIDSANELLQKEKNPKELVQQVASKGGTTEAGLKVLQENKIKELWNKVLAAATKRAEKLGK